MSLDRKMEIAPQVMYAKLINFLNQYFPVVLSDLIYQYGEWALEVLLRIYELYRNNDDLELSYEHFSLITRLNLQLLNADIETGASNASKVFYEKLPLNIQEILIRAWQKSEVLSENLLMAYFIASHHWDEKTDSIVLKEMSRLPIIHLISLKPDNIGLCAVLLAKLQFVDKFPGHIRSFVNFPSYQRKNFGLTWNLNLSRERLIDADLTLANLSFANLREANLTRADLESAVLRNADLRGAILISADLSGADLSYANLKGAHLNNIDLRKTILLETCLQHAILQNVNLTGQDLRGYDLTGVDLRGAKLVRVRLQDCNLTSANLTGLDLRNIDLRGVNLSKANLTRVDLRGVDLRGVQLDGANLRKAKLRGANLKLAKIEGCDFHKAEMDEDLQQEMRKRVLTLTSTRAVVLHAKQWTNRHRFLSMIKAQQNINVCEAAIYLANSSLDVDYLERIRHVQSEYKTPAGKPCLSTSFLYKLKEESERLQKMGNKAKAAGSAITIKSQ